MEMLYYYFISIYNYALESLIVKISELENGVENLPQIETEKCVNFRLAKEGAGISISSYDCDNHHSRCIILILIMEKM